VPLMQMHVPEPDGEHLVTHFDILFRITVRTCDQRNDKIAAAAASGQVKRDTPLIVLPLPSRARCQFSTLYSRKLGYSKIESSGWVFGSGWKRRIILASARNLFLTIGHVCT
jgi:hypothetical protein